ncbi:MAG TPA: hypothetical protein VGN95_19485 [Pyrinomonadaceae bacterium]|nr:hypothetical protein [Pyrinomonadaceae bacterium]
MISKTMILVRTNILSPELTNSATHSMPNATVRDDWELDDRETPKPEGKSARFYRFRVELAPRETEQLTVVEREDLQETYALTSISPDIIQLFVTRRYIDDATRAALQNIIDLTARVAAAIRTLDLNRNLTQ